MKTNKYIQLKKIYSNNKKYYVTYERIRNDYYGKPRYNITFFNQEQAFLTNINITTYNVEEDIKYFILENYTEEI